MANSETNEEWYLPEEMMCEILKYLCPKDMKTSRLVCKRWLEATTCLMRSMYKRTENVHSTGVECVPFDLCYISLFGKKYKNLLKNVNGEKGFKNWKFICGREGLYVEHRPRHTSPLPEGIEEFNGHKSCFAVSLSSCAKEQRINIYNNKYLSHLINDYKPHIYVSEWVAVPVNCLGRYEMSVTLKCGQEWSPFTQTMFYTAADCKGLIWQKIDFTIDTYPDDVQVILFEHYAYDPMSREPCSGIKMAGAVIKLLLNTAKM